MSLFNQFSLIAVEEGKKQHTDMGTVYSRNTKLDEKESTIDCNPLSTDLYAPTSASVMRTIRPYRRDLASKADPFKVKPRADIRPCNSLF